MAGPDPLGGADFDAVRADTTHQFASASQPAAPSEPDDSQPSGDKRRRSLLRDLPILVVVALVIAIVIKTFVVQAFVIPTGSMQNTLGLYNKILVNKLVYHVRAIHPGDIVVFDGTDSWDAPPPPSSDSGNLLVRGYDDTLRKVFDSVGGLFGTPIGQTDYVKRVIGVPGDHVACCNAQGLVTVNGVALHEQSYLYPGDQPGSSPAGIPSRFSVTVPAGYLWVLGDHRSVSDDSRGHEADPGNGMIPESAVIGRAFAVVWPASKWRILSIPATFEQPGITRSAAAGAASRANGLAAANLREVRVRPAAPYLPTTVGFAAAFPLWWLSKSVSFRRGHVRRRRTKVTPLAAGRPERRG